MCVCAVHVCASECGALAYYRKALSKYKRDLLSARAPFSNYVETGMAKNERILYEEPAAIAMQLAGRAHLKKKTIIAAAAQINVITHFYSAAAARVEHHPLNYGREQLLCAAERLSRQIQRTSVR
jgi:hypothetical protein